MLAEFLRTYIVDDAAVSAAIVPWRIADVRASAVRPAIDVVLVTADARLVVAIEPRGGGAHLVATRDLELSYYPEPGVTAHAAAAVVRALAAALARFEGGTSRRLPVVPSSGHRFVELRINRACNERCRFCNTPADSPTVLDGTAAVLSRIAAAASGGATALLLTGREPTLDPELPRYAATARELGIATIRVQTNATTLGHGPVLPALLAAGVTEFEVSLHTLDPTTFAALVGPAALLGHTVAGLDALAAHPAVSVTLVCVVTTTNQDELPALVDAIARRWPRIRTLTLSPVAPVGDGASAPELMVPLDQLGRHLGEVVARATARGLTAIIPARCGLPPCVLPPTARAHHEAVRSHRGGPVEPGKHKPPQCARCALDARCAGAWSAYLERGGADALVPIARQS